ncbi:MAG TPA: hypothetical protein VGB99_06445 [Acidobacteriota bacterium]|jgi:hypothetical protein
MARFSPAAARIGAALALAGGVLLGANPAPACQFGDSNCSYWDTTPEPCLMVEFMGRTTSHAEPQTAFCNTPTFGNIGTLERGASLLNPFESIGELAAYMNFKEYRAANGRVFGDICFDETHKIGDELRGVILPDGSLHFGWGIWPGSNQTVPATVGWKGFRMSGYLTYCRTTAIETRWHHGLANAIHCQWFGEISKSSQLGQPNPVNCRMGDTLFTPGLGADIWLIESEFCTGAFVDDRVCFKPVP